MQRPQLALPLARTAGAPISVPTNTDLATTGAQAITGTEPSEAQSGQIVLFTGNTFAAFSSDGGSTFTPINIAQVFGTFGDPSNGVCCDQVVQYVPSIDRFVWVAQFSAPKGKTENAYGIGVIRPRDLVQQGGSTGWKTAILKRSTFPALPAGSFMDYPDLEFTADDLWLTFNRIGAGGGTVAASFALNAIKNGSVATPFYLYRPASGGFRVAQLQTPDKVAYLSQFVNTSTIALWSVDKTSAGTFVTGDELKVFTVPVADWSTLNPELLTNPGSVCPNNEMMSICAKVLDYRILGATVQGSRLWLAWQGAKRDAKGVLRFKQVHIELAVVDVRDRTKLDAQLWLYNPNVAFARPQLATNSAGDVGITFAWGGGGRYWGGSSVGLLHFPAANKSSFYETGRGKSGGMPGHYFAIRPYYPQTRRAFTAGNFIQLKDAPSGGARNHPRFVVFEGSP